MSLLNIKDLVVGFRTGRGLVRAVDGVSLSLDQGQSLGLVGESGCGKTTLAKAIIGVLPANATIEQGQIWYKGRNILALEEASLRKIRCKEISLVPQSAMDALDPVRRVGEQILEAIRVHRNGSWDESLARSRLAEVFDLVGLDIQRARDYPHQLSGGMKQRVLIAIALVLSPALLIADEPTTSLDVIVQDQILCRLREIRDSLGAAMLLVSHDIAVVAENCDLIAVMYAGKLVEKGPAGDVLEKPLHPYTMGLLNAFPRLRDESTGLISIPGTPPDLNEPQMGCRFRPRCPFSTDSCGARHPELAEGGPDHFVACFRFDEAGQLRVLAGDRAMWEDSLASCAGTASGATSIGDASGQASRTLLQVKDLKTWFPLRQGLLSSIVGRGEAKFVRAVDGVSLTLDQGEILGLAGESGCGKSTTGLSIARLCDISSGDVLYQGHNWGGSGDPKAFRKFVQIIFQDPYASLNPRRSVLETLEKPLLIHGLGGGSRSERMNLIANSLTRAGLRPPHEYYHMFPHQLSGGQRQRVAIARAMVLNPRLLIADEPVSMLDVSIRASVLNILRRLSEELGVAILYISHDLSTIRYLCHRTAIMYLGRIMEIGPTCQIISSPRHPYTEALISAIPIPEVPSRRERKLLPGEAPNPIDLPPGCRFRPRCTRAQAVCYEAEPILDPKSVDHLVACHLA